MPRSHADPDRRKDDVIVYFDYAKSIENRRRPIPWKLVCKAMMLGGAWMFARMAMPGILGPASVVRGLFFLVPGAVLGLGVIQLVRVERALSGDNFTEAKRRGLPPGPPPASEEGSESSRSDQTT